MILHIICNHNIHNVIILLPYWGLISYSTFSSTRPSPYFSATRQAIITGNFMPNKIKVTISLLPHRRHHHLHQTQPIPFLRHHPTEQTIIMERFPTLPWATTSRKHSTLAWAPMVAAVHLVQALPVDLPHQNRVKSRLQVARDPHLRFHLLLSCPRITTACIIELCRPRGNPASEVSYSYKGGNYSPSLFPSSSPRIINCCGT